MGDSDRKRAMRIGVWVSGFAMILSSCVQVAEEDSSRNELVMVPGMKITATTSSGTILISAEKGFRRDYSWDGSSYRSVTLWPRVERWRGSLGAYYPGAGEHWPEHRGITRGVLQEGQQHFDTVGQALNWISEQTDYYPTVFRDDGLVVSYGKVLDRRQINVAVWQILIQGQKPAELAGSKNDGINVAHTPEELR